ncbi:MAG: HTH domain-containing protein [Candidatus Paceibacterota bacterium]|jgi:predicted transcriptional regulator
MKVRDFLVLKPTEEKIFNLLQKNRFLSVSEISKKLNIARTSIYNSLNTLNRKKITIKDGFLYSLCDNKYIKCEFKQNDSLSQINNFFEELLNLKKGEVIYSIETDEEIKSLFNDRINFLNWQKKISNKGIILKGIGSLKALHYFKLALSNNENNAIKDRSGSARFLNEPLSGNCTLIVFKESTVFLSRAKKFFYRIDNSFIANFLKVVIDRIYLDSKYEKSFR